MNAVLRYFLRPGHKVYRIHTLCCYAFLMLLWGFLLIESASDWLSLVLGAIMVVVTYAVLKIVREGIAQDQSDDKFHRASARRALRNAHRSANGQEWEDGDAE